MDEYEKRLDAMSIEELDAELVRHGQPSVDKTIGDKEESELDIHAEIQRIEAIEKEAGSLSDEQIDNMTIDELNDEISRIESLSYQLDNRKLPTQRPNIDTSNRGASSYFKDAMQSTLAGGLAVARQFDKNRAGVEQIYHGAMGNDEALADLGQQQAVRDAAYEGLSGNYPLSTMAGSVAPYLASAPFGVSSTAPVTASHLIQKSIGAGKVIGAGALEGAAAGAAHYDDSAISGAAFGGLGAAGGRFFGDLLGGATNKLQGPDRATVKYALDKDLFVPPGMRTGDPQLQQMDGAFKTHHKTISKYQDRLLKSKQAENRIISNEIGGDTADILSPEYLSSERSRIGGELDKLVKNTEGHVNDDMALRATDILDHYRRVDIDEAVPKLFKTHENKLYSLAESGAPISGKQYEDWSKELNETISDLHKRGETRKAQSLSGIAEIYNDAIGTGIPNEKLADWKKYRKQYALVESVETAKDRTVQKGAAGISGYVDADKLARIFKSSDAINSLSDVERLRRSQRSASLGTSGLLGRALKVNEPSQAIGALSLLGSRSKGKMPFIDELATSLYLSGYPHATGVAPILGRNTSSYISNLGSRMTMERD